jgi:predicted DNA-binding protein (MmcQ/YjbR family)
VTDDEILERLRRICLSFPEAEESTLQDRPLFHVGRRRFAIFNGADAPPRPRWATAGCSLHLLTDPAERDALHADPRFTPSPHHGDRGWMAVRLPPSTPRAAASGDLPSAPHGAHGTVPWEEITELLESGYRTAASRRLVERLASGP